jgi:hypothetical protein
MAARYFMASNFYKQKGRDNQSHFERKNWQDIGKAAFLPINLEKRHSPVDRLWNLICTRRDSNTQPSDP